MPGGTVKYVPLQPPEKGATQTCDASEWTVDLAQLEAAFSPKTKMIVSLIHRLLGTALTRSS